MAATQRNTATLRMEIFNFRYHAYKAYSIGLNDFKSYSTLPSIYPGLYWLFLTDPHFLRPA